MGESGRKTGRFTDDDPWWATGFKEGRAAITVFFLPDYQQKSDRRPLLRFQGFGHRQPGFDHGGAAPLHVGAPQAANDVAFLPWSKGVQIPGRHGIHMSHHVEPRFFGSHGDTQVITIHVNLLPFHAETCPAENLFQIDLYVFFLAGW